MLIEESIRNVDRQKHFSAGGKISIWSVHVQMWFSDESVTMSKLHLLKIFYWKRHMDCPSWQLLVAAADIVGASVLGHGWDGSYAGARVNIAAHTLVTCHQWQCEGEHVWQQLKLTHQHLHTNHFIPINQLNVWEYFHLKAGRLQVANREVKCVKQAAFTWSRFGGT